MEFEKLRDEFLGRSQLVELAVTTKETTPSVQSIKLAQLLVRELEISYIKELNKAFNSAIPMPSKLENVVLLCYDDIVTKYTK